LTEELSGFGVGFHPKLRKLTAWTFNGQNLFPPTVRGLEDVDFPATDYKQSAAGISFAERVVFEKIFAWLLEV